SLRGVPSDGYADEVAAADERVRRVELNPAGPGEKNLRPRVSRAAADQAARPRLRAASIRKTAKSLQLPLPSSSVSSGDCTPAASRAAYLNCCLISFVIAMSTAMVSPPSVFSRIALAQASTLWSGSG